MFNKLIKYLLTYLQNTMWIRAVLDLRRLSGVTLVGVTRCSNLWRHPSSGPPPISDHTESLLAARVYFTRVLFDTPD